MSKLPVRLQYGCDPSALGRTPAYVYETFGDDGRHLYIGATKNPWQRHREHRTRSSWFPLMRRVVITVMDGAAAALVLEAELIDQHRPPFNRRIDGTLLAEEWTADRLRERYGEYLTVEQVAEAAGIKASTFRSYVTRGEHAPQPDHRFGARSWAYKPETVAEWLTGRRRAAEEDQ